MARGPTICMPRAGQGGSLVLFTAAELERHLASTRKRVLSSRPLPTATAGSSWAPPGEVRTEGAGRCRLLDGEGQKEVALLRALTFGAGAVQLGDCLNLKAQDPGSRDRGVAENLLAM
jgi:hypothetical protein